jgi:hypothetical protein
MPRNLAPGSRRLADQVRGPEHDVRADLPFDHVQQSRLSRQLKDPRLLLVGGVNFVRLASLLQEFEHAPDFGLPARQPIRGKELAEETIPLAFVVLLLAGTISKVLTHPLSIHFYLEFNPIHPGWEAHLDPGGTV